ncbi:MAG: hypothetical protein R3A47_07450 [Polyangiales bacterium]
MQHDRNGCTDSYRVVTPWVASNDSSCDDFDCIEYTDCDQTLMYCVDPTRGHWVYPFTVNAALVLSAVLSPKSELSAAAFERRHGF